MPPYPSQLTMAPVPTLSTTQHHLPGAGEGAYTLCPFPTAASADQSKQQQVALFGGEDGILYVLPASSASSTSASTEPKAVRTFDEGIRSLAVSADGKRVAVGLESGETRIFAYESPYGSDGDDSSSSRGLHAFLNPPSASAAADDDGMGGMDDDDDDGFGGMMSQEDDAGLSASPTKSNSATGGMTEYAGPRFDAPVRDLAFLLPSSSSSSSDENTKYYLAIATESPASFCVVDVATADGAAGGERYLQTEAESSHDSGGVRGLAVGKSKQRNEVESVQV